MYNVIWKYSIHVGIFFRRIACECNSWQVYRRVYPYIYICINIGEKRSSSAVVAARAPSSLVVSVVVEVRIMEGEYARACVIDLCRVSPSEGCARAWVGHTQPSLTGSRTLVLVVAAVDGLSPGLVNTPRDDGEEENAQKGEYIYIYVESEGMKMQDGWYRPAQLARSSHIIYNLRLSSCRSTASVVDAAAWISSEKTDAIWPYSPCLNYM